MSGGLWSENRVHDTRKSSIKPPEAYLQKLLYRWVFIWILGLIRRFTVNNHDSLVAKLQLQGETCVSVDSPLTSIFSKNFSNPLALIKVPRSFNFQFL